MWSRRWYGHGLKYRRAALTQSGQPLDGAPLYSSAHDKPDSKLGVGGVRKHMASYPHGSTSAIITFGRCCSVTTLLHYVISNAVIPRLEREIQDEQAGANESTSRSPH